MQTPKVVPNYGIHWDGEGIAWLMQGRGSTNVLGIKKKPPFRVQLPSGSKHCNHMIPTSVPVPNDFQWGFFTQLMDDPLVQAALPIPKKASGAYFVEDPYHDLMWYMSMLSTMSSPIYPCVVPRWTTTEKSVAKQLEQTNVQPFFIADLEARDSGFLSKIAKVAMQAPRKLVVAGDPDVIVPQSMTRIKTRLNNSDYYDVNDLEALHWEGLGATLVRKHMKREPYGQTTSQYTGRKAQQT